MNVLMIGVDETSVGGMLTVIKNYLNDKEFCDKTNLHYIPTVIRANKFIKIKKFISKIPSIIRTIKKDDIDIVHVHMAERGSVFREGFVIWMANKMGCKTVIHMHGADIEKWYNTLNKYVKKIVRSVFCSADKMIILGENWKSFMEKVMWGYENKIVVLHNAVKIESVNKGNKNAKNILFYGMLIQRKGIDDLLEAFKDAADKIPNEIVLTLYGDDHDADEPIEKKVERINLPGRIKYKGWMTPEIRKDVFSNSLINILPSYNEGLPMTILESMGYGIPNISTNIAAIPEAIEDGVNGYIVEPGDKSTLSKRIQQICNNGFLWEKMSRNAYKKSKEEFSLEEHFKKLIKIYDELLD